MLLKYHESKIMRKFHNYPRFYLDCQRKMILCIVYYFGLSPGMLHFNIKKDQLHGLIPPFLVHENMRSVLFCKVLFPHLGES